MDTPARSQPDGTPAGPARTGPDIALSRRLARLMDDVVSTPGGRYGIGLDALVGLVPGIGDLAGSTMSGVILYDAIRCRVPVPTLAMMGWNLILGAVLGLVPGVGDLLDVAHRANRKNLRLLERAVAANPHPDPPTAGYLVAAVLVAMLPLLLGLAIGLVVLWWLWQWVSARF